MRIDFEFNTDDLSVAEDAARERIAEAFGGKPHRVVSLDMAASPAIASQSGEVIAWAVSVSVDVVRLSEKGWDLE